MSRLLIVLLCVSCTEASKKGRKRDRIEPAPLIEETPAPDVVVTDEGPSSGYEDSWFGHYNRGRGVTAEDFDGDGDLDVFSANPAGESFLIRNVTPPGGPLLFEPWQVLSYEAFYFLGAAGDVDNDGDPDLYVATGGNDGYEIDRFYRNDGDDEAPLVFVSELAPVDEAGLPVATGSMGAIWFDANDDALLDVFTSNNVASPFDVGQLDPESIEGMNQLWINQGDGTFVDAAADLGIDRQLSSRNSDVLDFDADGDLDVFENNFMGASILWRNLLVETGATSFEDVTDAHSLGGGDLAEPRYISAMCSIAADLDNDGWEDIVVFRRIPKDPSEPEVHAEGHLMWMNVAGTGFVEVASYSNLNADFLYRDHAGKGVMGCQIGDADLDGFPDIFLGNGGGEGGERNQLLVSAHRTEVEIEGVGLVRVPQFDDWSAHIDFPPPAHHRHEPIGNETYPFRTHGSIFADFDGDGVDELAVHNGGPGFYGGEEMQEPNRLFRFEMAERPHWLRVRVVGDGIRVNRDGIGTRVRVRVARSTDGVAWDLYKRRKSSTGFGAQNGPLLVFGLGDADRIEEIEVTWPDGLVTTPPIDALDAVLTIAHPGAR